MAHILVAEDVEDIQFAYEAILRKAGHKVATVSNGQEAKTLLQTDAFDFDLIMTDLLMANGDGMDLASYVHSLKKRPKLLVVTGGGSRISADQAIKMSQYLFDASLSKPVSQDVLLDTINELMSKS